MQTIRGMTKAEVAQAIELESEGLTLKEVAQELGKMPTLVQSCVILARKHGFAAWEKVSQETKEAAAE